MTLVTIAAVRVHAADPAAAFAWYEAAFAGARRATSADGSFTFLRVGDVQLEVVRADDKVASGPAGTVVYWHVERLDEAIAGLGALGARLYRGPMAIEAGLSMCQVQDPWGNCVGLRGSMGPDRR